MDNNPDKVRRYDFFIEEDSLGPSDETQQYIKAEEDKNGEFVEYDDYLYLLNKYKNLKKKLKHYKCGVFDKKNF